MGCSIHLTTLGQPNRGLVLPMSKCSSMNQILSYHGLYHQPHTLQGIVLFYSPPYTFSPTNECLFYVLPVNIGLSMDTKISIFLNLHCAQFEIFQVHRAQPIYKYVSHLVALCSPIMTTQISRLQIWFFM